ncbi:MAG: D-glycero-alpha-D-manno-heptose-1,7-bisphosphate 7-phosphatase [bacterium]
MDRDGVINLNRPDYVKSWDEFIFYPFAKLALSRLAKSDFLIIIVSNQSSIGRGIVKKETVDEINERMKEEIEKEGGRIDAIYYCPHKPNEGCPCRKPNPGLLLKAAEEWDIDLRKSYMIGDALSDIEAGKRAGCFSILVLTGRGREQLHLFLDSPYKYDKLAVDLLEAVDWILKREKIYPFPKSSSDDEFREDVNRL